jgi:hypothetical protein
MAEAEEVQATEVLALLTLVTVPLEVAVVEVELTETKVIMAMLLYPMEDTEMVEETRLPTKVVAEVEGLLVVEVIVMEKKEVLEEMADM